MSDQKENKFPPHDPNYPDVDPKTGDERETTNPPRSRGVTKHKK